MRGLEKQIADDAYCMDILTQSLALQKSLASLNKLILERHLRTHIADKIASGDEIQQNEAVEELLNLYELNNIRTKWCTTNLILTATQKLQPNAWH